jgi:hypothetical protein
MVAHWLTELMAAMDLGSSASASTEGEGDKNGERRRVKGVVAALRAPWPSL